MNYHNGNLAREAGRLHGWREKFWSRRYQAVLVSDEEEAQVARLKYLLSHGAKEGLVPKPQDWPGVHCAHALLLGTALEGLWWDRTLKARQRRGSAPAAGNPYPQHEELPFSPLPCWRHLRVEDYRRRIASLMEDIAQEISNLRAQRLPCRRRCVQRILRQSPEARPSSPPSRRPTPDVHAYRNSKRALLRAAYGDFVVAFRRAAAQLRSGDREAQFPPGSFPPAAPFNPYPTRGP
jgi:hypothetical protein